MLKYLSNKIFSDRYESKTLLGNYIKCQYGPFLKDNSTNLYESFYQLIQREAALYIDSNYDVLDVGCATGRLVFEYEKMGASKSHGIDSSKNFIDFCNLIRINESDLVNFEVNPASKTTFLCADILQSPYLENSFDFISCINIIDRVVDPKKLVETIYSNLKVGGILLLTDPYDWEYSPAERGLHVNDMKVLLGNEKWVIEKEIRDISYVVPISSYKDRTYVCHLVVARKKP